MNLKRYSFHNFIHNKMKTIISLNQKIIVFKIKNKKQRNKQLLDQNKDKCLNKLMLLAAMVIMN